MISVTSLVENLKASRWQLIEVPRNILILRSHPAVASLNDTEIAIMGGFSDKNLSDVIVLNTTTKKCQKVTNGGGYKFEAKRNQSAHAGINKVFAFVQGDKNSAVISWTKGSSSATVLKWY